MHDLVCFFDIDELKKNASFFNLKEFVIVKKFKEKEAHFIRQNFFKKGLTLKLCHLLEPNSSSRMKADFLGIEIKSLSDFSHAERNNADFVFFNQFSPVDMQSINLLGKKTEIVFSFNQMLYSNSFERALIFKKMIFASKLAKKAGLKLRVYSLAIRPSDLRNPNSLNFIVSCLEGSN